MFDTIGRAAERAAEGVSRRDFFGRLGRGAAVLAAGLGGVLLTARNAEASNGMCCVWWGGCHKGQCKKNEPYGTTVRCTDLGYPCG